MDYIFDFDGTICDSFEVVLETANKYLAKHGKQVTAHDIRSKGIEKLLKEYKLSTLQTLLFVYKGRREFQKFESQLKVFDGLPPVLAKLSLTNRLGVLSTNSRENVYKILSRNKLLDLFAYIISEPFLFNKAKRLKTIIKKNKLNPKEVFYIGDEIRDIKAGYEANVNSVGVTWGYEGQKLMKESKPDFLVSSPQELLLLGKQLKH